MTLITATATARHKQSQHSDVPANRQRWKTVEVKNTSAGAAWANAQKREVNAGAYWHQVSEKDICKSHAWGTAIEHDTDASTGWYQVPEKDLHQQLAWQKVKRTVDLKWRVRFKPRVPEKDSTQTGRFGRVDEFGVRRSPEQLLRESLYLPNTLPLVFNFNGRAYQPHLMPEIVFDFRYEPAPNRIQPVDSRTHRVRWGIADQINQLSRIRWGLGTPTDPIPSAVRYPDWDGPVIILPDPESAGEPEIKETYMIGNSVSVTVDGVPISAPSFTIERDIDSIAWQLNLQLFGRSSLELVKPDGTGNKVINIVINGHAWDFVVTRYSSAEKFPAERFTVYGASRTQLLGEPYAPKFSAVNAVDINARQAVEDLLINTGFTVQWDSVNQNPPDWTITAGALTYTEQTPMQVASRVAESIGAVIRPHLTAQEFAVVPRYRDPVWLWNSTLVDRIIPSPIVTDIAGEWAPQPEYNSCYVSGVSFGVAVDVRRAGSAGDKPAPDVYDDLITDTVAARQRGIAEICKGGNQEIVTLTIPLFPADNPPGLIQPAMLVEVRPHNDDNWRGLCLATSIAVTNISTVKQTVKLERHHGNS